MILSAWRYRRECFDRCAARQRGLKLTGGTSWYNPNLCRRNAHRVELEIVMGRFGVGQSVPRAAGIIVSSPVPAGIRRTSTCRTSSSRNAPIDARADILGIDASDAIAMPGVLAIVTARDIDGLGDLRCAISVKRPGSRFPAPAGGCSPASASFRR